MAEDAALRALVENAHQLFLPAIVLGEYRFGLRNSRHRRSLLPMLEALESDCVVLAVDSVTAREYADIRSELKAVGTPIPVNDLWIAALARQHDLAIVSRDTHFDRVKGVKRKGW